MRREAESTPTTEQAVRDVELDHGCILCGGKLELRLSAGGATSYCRTCRWISRPQMQRDDDGQVHVIHPVAGTA
jgi:hypothetical protein